MNDWTVPPHVPPELVVDLDIYDVPGGETDPATAWRAFQGKGPLAFSPRHGGHWVATCGADIPSLYRDFRHLSNRQVAIPHPGNIMYPIQADPPLHKEYRAIITPLFTNEAVDALEPAIRELTISLIEGFRKRGECDFVNEFALQFPLTIFLRLMGLPVEDLRYLRQLVETSGKQSDVAVKRRSNEEMARYLEEWFARRIEVPAEDGLTLISNARIRGGRLTREEMVSTAVMLLKAGLDTVANFLAFIAHLLARYPEQRQYVRNHLGDTEQIVKELLRRFPVANIARYVASDWTYRGIQLKEGDRIMLPISLYNLDPERVSDPDDVDFSRPADHATFGSGRHTCAGAILARKEVAVFLEEWLTRIPDFSVDENKPPKFIATPANSVVSLWLKWPVPRPDQKPVTDLA